MTDYFNPEAVIQQFDAAASTYDGVALMQQQSAERLIERLHYIQCQRETVLDLGAGTGQCCQLLRGQYPDMTLLALDRAPNMLAALQQKQLSVTTLCADATAIPLPDNSVDCVVSNMMLHWSLDIPLIFAEVNRVLREGGVFLFTTLGPDTLHELRRSWASVDDYNHVHHFYDMHDIGDALLQAGFQDPVMDVDWLTLRYRSLSTLFDDMKALGARNVAEPRKPGLTTKRQWQAMLDHYEQFKQDETYPASYEVVYGHAWGKRVANPGEVLVSIEDIVRG